MIDFDVITGSAPPQPREKPAALPAAPAPQPAGAIPAPAGGGDTAKTALKPPPASR